MKNILVHLIFLVLSLIPLNSYAQGISYESFGKGIKVQAKDSSFYAKIGFRFQSLFSSSLNLENDVWDRSMMIRRSRLKAEGWALSPKFSYKVELALSNRDIKGGSKTEFGNTANIILDAVLKYHINSNWSLWFGQTKLPGNRERVFSSQKLQFVDRSLVNARFNLDRDVGVQLHHKGNIGNLVVKEDFDAERDKFGRIVGKSGGRPRDGGGDRDRGPRNDRDRRDMSSSMGGGGQGGGYGNTYGLSPQFLENLGIDGPLHTRLFVVNLSYTVDVRKLREVFRLAGRVVMVELNRDLVVNILILIFKTKKNGIKLKNLNIFSIILG